MKVYILIATFLAELWLIAGIVHFTEVNPNVWWFVPFILTTIIVVVITLGNLIKEL